LPAETTPLAPYRDQVEFLGRVGHGEMPARLASADVFVFPSLFEGSAVVTYEALACGLPSVVTPSSGSVARDGIEGLVVPAGEVEPLARAIETLGLDAGLRERMAIAARQRSLEFTWPRYHEAVARAIDDCRSISR
jgi:glycosyltransferase involved in cell wall biosynthesis